MAVNTTGLSECYKKNRDTLLDTIIEGAKSAVLFNIQAGIKSSDYLHIATTEVNFADCACKKDTDDTTHTFVDRIITVGCVQVDDHVCAKDFLKTYQEAEINIIAGHETLGEVGGVLAHGFATAIANRQEKAIWQGDKTSTDRNLNKYDGIIKIMTDETDVTKLDLTAVTDSWELLKALVRALPESAYLRGEDTAAGALPVIIMGTALYRSITLDMAEMGINSCCPPLKPEKFRGLDSFLYPQTNVRIIGVPGMNGSGKIIGGSLYDLYLGTDMENDEEEIDAWWSQDDDEWRQRAKFQYGTQIAFPRDMYLATYTGSAVLPLNAPLSAPASAPVDGGEQLTDEQIIANAKAAYLAAYDAKQAETEETGSGVKGNNTKNLNAAIATLDGLGIAPEDVIAERENQI